jgi:formate-dependent nitrite reductase membrane component NrfD
VAAAGYTGFVLARRWPLLVAGVAGMTLVVPEALGDWADGSVPAAAVLLVAGLTLLGSSAASLRLHHRG